MLMVCLLCRSLPTCDSSCTVHGTCKGLLLNSTSSSTPFAGVGIRFMIDGISSYGGRMVFTLHNSVDVMEVVRETYQFPVMMDLMWTQQSCIPPAPDGSSGLSRAASLMSKTWEQVQRMLGVKKHSQD